jgi:RNA chaperone Hfq
MHNNFVLQDILLNQIRRERSVAQVVAANGCVFQGKIHGFDNETIILDRLDGSQVLLYKKNLLSVTPNKPVLTETESNIEK